MIFKNLAVWKRIWIFAVMFLGVVSIVDYFAMEKAKVLGLDLNMATPFMQTYIFSFWTLFMVSLFALGGFYYFFVRKDKSEALGVVAVGWIMQNFGVEDVLYYFLRFTWMPSHLDYLDTHWIIGRIGGFLGPHVTPFSLMVSVGLGLFLSWIIIKKLWRI